MRRIYCYGSLDGLCESAAGQRRMLGGGRQADRILSLNLSEWVTLFRVGVAHETSPYGSIGLSSAPVHRAVNVVAAMMVVKEPTRLPSLRYLQTILMVRLSREFGVGSELIPESLPMMNYMLS